MFERALVGTMGDARGKIEQWRVEYNTEGPYSSLNDMAPYEYAQRMALTG